MKTSTLTLALLTTAFASISALPLPHQPDGEDTGFLKEAPAPEYKFSADGNLQPIDKRTINEYPRTEISSVATKQEMDDSEVSGRGLVAPRQDLKKTTEEVHHPTTSGHDDAIVALKSAGPGTHVPGAHYPASERRLPCGRLIGELWMPMQREPDGTCPSASEFKKYTANGSDTSEKRAAFLAKGAESSESEEWRDPGPGPVMVDFGGPIGREGKKCE